MDCMQAVIMSKRNSPDNPILRKLIKKLRKKGKELDTEIWTDLADRLYKSNRSRAEVNISQINRHTEDGDTIVVPGKILGSGRLNHSITAAAFEFSSRAQSRIQDAGGNILSVEELLEQNPEGTDVDIME